MTALESDLYSSRAAQGRWTRSPEADALVPFMGVHVQTGNRPCAIWCHGHWQRPAKCAGYHLQPRGAFPNVELVLKLYGKR